MNDTGRDLHEALDRLVRSGPPSALRTPDVLAAGRRARRHRSLLAGTGAGAAAAAVIVAAGLLMQPTAPAGPDQLPAASPGSRSPAAVRSQPPVPGLSPAEIRELSAGCAESYGGSGGRIGTLDPSAAPLPDPSVPAGPMATLVEDPSAPLLRDVVRVYNTVREGDVTTTLLYGPAVVLTCTVDGAGRAYNAGGGIGDRSTPDWLPGPVAVDAREWADGRLVVAGRVVGSVTRVEVAYGDRTRSVPAVNGTYLALIPVPTGDPAPGLTVRAYDRGGDLVGETGGTSRAVCHVTPDGTRIGGDRTDPDQRCLPAVRWR